jgi:hypothetical protein
MPGHGVPQDSSPLNGKGMDHSITKMWSGIVRVWLFPGEEGGISLREGGKAVVGYSTPYRQAPREAFWTAVALYSLSAPTKSALPHPLYIALGFYRTFILEGRGIGRLDV